MTIPLTSECSTTSMRARRQIASGPESMWRSTGRRIRASIERFLRSAVPPAPELIFPDSGSPFTQFPTLSELKVLPGGTTPPVWDQPGEGARATLVTGQCLDPKIACHPGAKG